MWAAYSARDVASGRASTAAAMFGTSAQFSSMRCSRPSARPPVTDTAAGEADRGRGERMWSDWARNAGSLALDQRMLPACQPPAFSPTVMVQPSGTSSPRCTVSLPHPAPAPLRPCPHRCNCDTRYGRRTLRATSLRLADDLKMRTPRAEGRRRLGGEEREPPVVGRATVASQHCAGVQHRQQDLAPARPEGVTSLLTLSFSLSAIAPSGGVEQEGGQLALRETYTRG